jgi:hypothetical protein
MENILLVSDCNSLPTATIEFACYLAKLTDSKLTGVFLEHFPKEEVPVVKNIFGIPMVETIVASDLPGYNNIKKHLQENITLFTKTCLKHSVLAVVRTDKQEPISDLVTESLYADLIIVDPTLSVDATSTRVPSKLIKNFLNESKCPVIFPPLDFETINEIKQ